MNTQDSQSELEEILRARVKVIGDNEWTVLGYPDELIKSLEAYVTTRVKEALEEMLDRLDKSMPTAEQLTTKYGYHMPDKQYGYKLALHDIREVLAKMEAEL